VGSCSEVYLEKAFTDACLQPEERLSVAKQLGETSLAFLVHPTLTKENMEYMSEKVCEVVSEATK
jgi:dTDP-4-amino-4,6-dideoxygalactose transaminase